jgi:putative nucleotidyltransferase with HDIG domain
VFQLFGGNDQATKRDFKLVDWTHYFQAASFAMSHAVPGASIFERAERIAALAKAGPNAADELVEIRCARGASIAARLGFGPKVAAAIAALDEHWDGNGRPARFRGEEIPIAARILLLAQTLDVFTWNEGAEVALEMAKRRAGTWFDPRLVEACTGLAHHLSAWRSQQLVSLQHAVRMRDPAPQMQLAGEGALADVAEAFASIVDAKSPFTQRHSRRVADITMAIAREQGVDSEMFRVAALLHDLGKLAVPNSILDKPGPLTEPEWKIMRRHPEDSLRILQRLKGLGAWANVAAAHHERLDGQGYHLALDAARLNQEARILAVADVYESLTADRPYRSSLTRSATFKILESGRGSAFDAECIEALKTVLDRGELQDDAGPDSVPRAA